MSNPKIQTINSKGFNGIFEFLKSRSLIVQLAKKEVLVRYKQTFLGIVWALLQPLFIMLVFSLVFGIFAGLSDAESKIPYSLLVLTGFLCWQLFSQVISSAGDSLINNAHILKKIYFPRIIFPISSSLSSFLEFLISLSLFLGFCFYYQVSLSYKAFFSVLLSFQTYCLALGIGLIVASLNVRYRDFKHIIPVILRLGFYISPIGYGMDFVPERYRDIYSYNPVVGIINGFRWSLLSEPLDMRALLISLIFTIVFLLIGYCFFMSMERKFADEI